MRKHSAYGFSASDGSAFSLNCDRSGTIWAAVASEGNASHAVMERLLSFSGAFPGEQELDQCAKILPREKGGVAILVADKKHISFGRRAGAKLYHFTDQSGGRTSCTGTAEMPELGKDRIRGCGMHAILLCTEGVWRSVTEDEMLLDLCAAETAKQWLQALRYRLLAGRFPGWGSHAAVAILIE